MQPELFAVPASCFGKMSPAYSAVTTDEILLAWLAHWLGPTSLYRETDGKTPVLLSDRTGWSSGACWTRNTSDWRNGASVCSLSSILDTGKIASRYFLSPKYCVGILRRAENRGKALPPPLRRALMGVADSAPTSSAITG